LLKSTWIVDMEYKVQFCRALNTCVSVLTDIGSVAWTFTTTAWKILVRFIQQSKTMHHLYTQKTFSVQ